VFKSTFAKNNLGRIIEEHIGLLFTKYDEEDET